MLSSCSSELASIHQDRHENTTLISDLRSEISDLRHELSNTQVELQILEEQIQQLSSKKGGQELSLEKKITNLEQKQDKISSEFKQTNGFISEDRMKLSELEVCIKEQKKLLLEALDIKASLKALSQADKTSFYQVKPGDSLEKIARNHHVSVEDLQKENKLSSHKILIGQELKIPGKL